MQPIICAEQFNRGCECLLQISKTLIRLEQELDQNWILEGADFLDTASGEILKNIKSNRLVAATAPKRSTFMDVYLKKIMVIAEITPKNKRKRIK